MPLRSALARGFAAAALVTLCGATPALADDGWDSADPGSGQYDNPGDPQDPDHLVGVGNTGAAATDDFLGPGGTGEPEAWCPARDIDTLGRTPRWC
ncbi:hypothetical protein ACIRQQ_29235 [Streptomyces fuscichromogenes]|uniref:hypothetical protein n=1 Tax=Streptomyces fuscichromogenes TaxID=1324013 RepID=UPI0037F89573